MKASLKRLWALCALMLALCGCAAQDLPEEEDTALLPAESAPEEAVSHLPEHLSLPYDPALTLDPYSCAEGMQQTVSSLLYEGLFRLDAQFQPQPWLCETYAYAPETLCYTFTLRSDVTFSDGAPLTAEDVKASLDHARTSPRYAARLTNVRTTAAEENTVTVTLSAANAAFPSLLDIPITKKGTQGTFVPTGTGPYFFSREESGDHLIASQSWWQGELQPADRIALVEADGYDAMLYRFTSRDVQLITADLTARDTVSIPGSVALYDAPTAVMQYVGVNPRSVESSALRRALSLGIDRKTVAEAYLSGHALPAAFPISPACGLYPKEAETAYSKDAFLQAISLCEALPAQPLRLIVNEENTFRVSVARFIAASYSAAGVVTEVSVLPWEEYLTALRAGDFDLYYGEIRLSADWDLRSLLARNGAVNYGKWQREETDALLALCAETGDLSPLWEHLSAEAPLFPVCFKTCSVLTQADVIEGLSPTAAEPFYALPEIRIHLK